MTTEDEKEAEGYLKKLGSGSKKKKKMESLWGVREMTTANKERHNERIRMGTIGKRHINSVIFKDPHYSPLLNSPAVVKSRKSNSATTNKSSSLTGIKHAALRVTAEANLSFTLSRIPFFHFYRVSVCQHTFISFFFFLLSANLQRCRLPPMCR